MACVFRPQIQTSVLGNLIIGISILNEADRDMSPQEMSVLARQLARQNVDSHHKYVNIADPRICSKIPQYNGMK